MVEVLPDAPKTARVHPLVRERLGSLQTALEKEFGISAGPEIIVGALLHGTTLGQLVGLINVFTRYAAAYQSLTAPDYRSPPPL